MGNQNLVVLIILGILLGVCSGFINFNFGQLEGFLGPVSGIGYSYWMWYSGNCNNGDEKSGLP